ncbi:RagB/SusD family nutrient uptake outer membrane protein [Chitinophaga defluvii]|uniref:RagB/SusD family nutrient uptake outer membrane protein n=1 Tax=Chitinophaga defluvii TaxID=3163343 RepID=A0ABV2T8P8_9BACT
MYTNKVTPFYIKFFFSLSIISYFCATGWLEVKPDTKLATPTTLKDFQSLLDNASIMNGSCPGLGEYASDGHYLTDNTFQTASNILKNAYTWSHEFVYREVTDWTTPYARIFYCNVILEGLEKSEKKEDGEYDKDNIKGQALFQRAKALYELTEIWAPPYDPHTSKTVLSIPLKLKSDINDVTVRATAYEVLNQIINDLSEAKGLLPLNQTYVTRASKSAAFALLARIYISQEDYANAEKYADSCLRLNSQLVDYNSINAEQSYPISPTNNNEILFHSILTTWGTSINFLIDPALYKLYDTTDLRRDIFFTKNLNGEIRYKGSYDGRYTFFNGLAVDEVYLIMAECSARLGKVATAIDYLNKLLLKRHNSNFTPLTASTPNQALDLVLTERRKELLCRGLRWSDLRRLNKDPRLATTIQRAIAQNKYSLEPGSYKYTFPIPDDVFQLSRIEQNPGW